MKKIILLLSIVVTTLFSSTSLSAQGKFGPDSVECIKYLSYYTEYFKQKNYELALPNWRKAYSICPPTARYSVLSDGTTLMRQLISKNAYNPAYKAQLIDSLMVLYDKRIEFWPKYAVSSLNNKALDMYNYMKDEPMKLFEGLTEVVEKNGVKTRTNIFLFQFNTACDLYKDGELDAETVINVYDTAIKNLSNITPKNDIERRSIEKMRTDIESLFIASQVASCENIIKIFSPRFESDPENLDLAKNIVKMLSSSDECTDNDLFLNAVTLMYEKEPTHNSAYYLYRLHSSKNNVDLAVQYMQEAIAAEDSDPVADASYLYELAAYSFKNSNNQMAYECAQKAAELDASVAGKAYMLMGTIWGILPCSGNEIEQRAKYWVAVDFMTKAKNADETLTEDANNHINQYLTYYPETAEAFMYDVIDGQSYTVSCSGFRATTTVRTKK